MAVVLPFERDKETQPHVPARSSRLTSLYQRLRAAFAAEADRFALWLPVFIAIGVATYFALPAKPPDILVAGAALLMIVAALALPAVAQRRLAWILAALASGFLAAHVRTSLVEAPVIARELGMREVEGTVRWFEPLEAEGRLRLILEHPKVQGLDAGQTPRRIRIRLAGAQTEPSVGDRIRLLASLSPPPGEIAPGSYNFARVAWFQRIGAVGFAGGKFTVVESAAQGASGAGRFFARLRAAIQERVRAALPARTAAFVTALITGARGAMPHEDLVALQNSGLLHILSISGLHLALVAGLMLLVLRRTLALIEAIAVGWPLKKIAAVLALGVSAFYVALSGGDVATMRSFLMLTVAIGAILIDRPAITLRTIAFAAVVLLLLAPDQLFNPSFQLSFAAVTALVAGYEWARQRRGDRTAQIAWWTRPARIVAGIAATTLLAETATAPIVAYHFNQFVLGGLIANEIAIPLVGFWIMPLAVLAVLAMPFHLEALPLQLMGRGIEQLLALARWTASLPHAVTFFEAWPLYALLIIVAGGLWLAVWRSRLRYLGALPVAIGIALAIAARGPDVIADESGALAFRVREGNEWRYGLVGVRARSFKGEAWVRRLGGDPAGRADAGDLMHCDALGCIVPVGKGAELSLVRDGRALREECARSRAILSQVDIPVPCAAPKAKIDPVILKKEGPIALRLAPNVASLQRSPRGDWPWQSPIRPRERSDSEGPTSDDQ